MRLWTGTRSVLQSVHEAIDHTDVSVEVQVDEETIGNEALGHPPGTAVGTTDGVQNVLPDGITSCGIGAKLLKSGSGSAVASSETISDSALRSRKVAVSYSDQSSDQFVRKERSREIFIRYKTF